MNLLLFERQSTGCEKAAKVRRKQHQNLRLKLEKKVPNNTLKADVSVKTQPHTFFIILDFVGKEFIAVEISKYKSTKPMPHKPKPFSQKLEKKSFLKSDVLK